MGRSPKEMDVYKDGAEIPVQLVYDRGEENEAVEEARVAVREPMRLGREAARLYQTTFVEADRRRHHPRPRRSILQHGFAQQQTTKEPIHEGPHIVKLKVRRGGVAIAGPGGIATAGSGGTAIVGPGGTAYTTPDGTAVVGPGGRLIELPGYVTRGRSTQQIGRLIAIGPVIYYPLNPWLSPITMSSSLKFKVETHIQS